MILNFPNIQFKKKSLNSMGVVSPACAARCMALCPWALRCRGSAPWSNKMRPISRDAMKKSGVWELRSVMLGLA